MGMILYTQSGTFVPSDHGLNVGDTIHIVAVGGAVEAQHAGITLH